MKTSKQTNVPYSLNFKGKLVELNRPLVMGILNLTTDSFYDGGKFTEERLISEQVEKMVSEGADIIDVGASSSRPGSTEIDQKLEESRLEPVIKMLAKSFPSILISVDTTRSVVAEKVVDWGADMINDISAGDYDKNMFATIAKLSVPYAIMHMQGTPKEMQNNPSYNNVVKEVNQYLNEKVYQLQEYGINDGIIDPGFGFGKSLEHNLTMLKHFHQFSKLGYAVLAGISRKSMLGKLTGKDTHERLAPSVAAAIMAADRGARIVRVHDVPETVDALKLWEAIDL
jgi:dihydropteroate synthase